jgi:hypothetical protein
MRNAERARMPTSKERRVVAGSVCGDRTFALSLGVMDLSQTITVDRS